METILKSNLKLAIKVLTKVEDDINTYLSLTQGNQTFKITYKTISNDDINYIYPNINPDEPSNVREVSIPEAYQFLVDKLSNRLVSLINAKNDIGRVKSQVPNIKSAIEDIHGIDCNLSKLVNAPTKVMTLNTADYKIVLRNVKIYVHDAINSLTGLCNIIENIFITNEIVHDILDKCNNPEDYSNYFSEDEAKEAMATKRQAILEEVYLFNSEIKKIELENIIRVATDISNLYMN